MRINHRSTFDADFAEFCSPTNFGVISTARRAAQSGWTCSNLEEVPDELVKGRAIDLAAKPCGVVLMIQGRAYVDFETILPVECKRLPIPKGKDRDEREYVYSAYSSTGGIQRFKAGAHGSAHKLAAMIGYVQEGAPSVWRQRIDDWIRGLAQQLPSEWSLADLLQQLGNPTVDVFRLKSQHARKSTLEAIALEHLWLSMN